MPLNKVIAELFKAPVTNSSRLSGLRVESNSNKSLKEITVALVTTPPSTRVLASCFNSENKVSTFDGV